VVESGAGANLFDFAVSHAEGFGDERGVSGYFLRVALGVVIFRVDSVSQRSNGIQNGLRKRIRTLRLRRRGLPVVRFRGRKRLRELAQALVDFLKSFGTRREKPLERDAEISFENVALPLFGFVGIKMVGGGNRVAALVFRKIHRSIGNLNEFLRR